MFSWIDKALVAQLKDALGTYFRAALVAVLTLYMNGVTEPEALLNAAIAAVLAPVIRALNPKDEKYGLAKKK